MGKNQNSLLMFAALPCGSCLLGLSLSCRVPEPALAATAAPHLYLCLAEWRFAPGPAHWPEGWCPGRWRGWHGGGASQAPSQWSAEGRSLCHGCSACNPREDEQTYTSARFIYSQLLAVSRFGGRVWAKSEGIGPDEQSSCHMTISRLETCASS